MAEGNGAGRMDRIERTLEMLAEHQVKLEQNQEEFQRDLKQLLTSQVLQGDRLEKLATIVEENSRQIAEHSRQIAEHSRQMDEQRARGDDIDTRMGKLRLGNRTAHLETELVRSAHQARGKGLDAIRFRLLAPNIPKNFFLSAPLFWW